MRTVLIFTAVCLALQFSSTNSAILFPEEVPTLTGIIYSLLPPIKIGKDSRFGVGFRLGRNADAQVLIELGPQVDTQPLGDGTNKRQSPDRKQGMSPAEREQLLRMWLDKVQKLTMRQPDNNSSVTSDSTKTVQNSITDNKE